MALARSTSGSTSRNWACYAFERLSELKGVLLVEPKTGRTGVVSFLVDGVHSHDMVSAIDQSGGALRGGHHCTQPFIRKLGVESTARASLYFDNTKAEAARLIEVMAEIQQFFNGSIRRL